MSIDVCGCVCIDAQNGWEGRKSLEGNHVKKQISFIAAGVLVAVVCCAPASAGTVTSTVTGIDVLNSSLEDNWGVDGSGITGRDNPHSDWAATQGTWATDDGHVGPGVGGQDFDIEAFYSGFDTSNNTLYFAMVTGFDLRGEWGSYEGGDVFIDFGQDDGWDLAFELSDFFDGGAANTDFSGTVDALTGPMTTVDPHFTDSTPWRVDTPADTEADAVSFSYEAEGIGDAGDDHNVYQFSYVVNDSNWLDDLLAGGEGYTVHWTMSCGNDAFDLAMPAVVPAPSAALLGVLGSLVVFVRRRIRD